MAAGVAKTRAIRVTAKATAQKENGPPTKKWYRTEPRQPCPPLNYSIFTGVLVRDVPFTVPPASQCSRYHPERADGHSARSTQGSRSLSSGSPSANVGTSFWLPTTQITMSAPEAYGPIWLPPPDATNTCPCSVTACTLPNITSGPDASLRHSRFYLTRSSVRSCGLMATYRPDASISLVTPIKSMFVDMAAWTSAPFLDEAQHTLRPGRML